MSSDTRLEKHPEGDQLLLEDFLGCGAHPRSFRLNELFEADDFPGHLRVGCLEPLQEERPSSQSVVDGLLHLGVGSLNKLDEPRLDGPGDGPGSYQDGQGNAKHDQQDDPVESVDDRLEEEGVCGNRGIGRTKRHRRRTRVLQQPGTELTQASNKGRAHHLLTSRDWDGWGFQ